VLSHYLSILLKANLLNKKNTEDWYKMAPDIIELRRIDEIYHANGRPIHAMLAIATQFQQNFHGFDGIENALTTVEKMREQKDVSLDGADLPLMPGERDFYASAFQPDEILADPDARQTLVELQSDLQSIVVGGTCCMNTMGDKEQRQLVIDNARALQHLGIETYTIFAGNPADQIIARLGLTDEELNPKSISDPRTQRAIRNEYKKMVRELVQDIRKVYGGFILIENCPMQRTFKAKHPKWDSPVTNWAGTPYLLDAFLEATEDMPGVGVMIDWSHLYNQCLLAHAGDHDKAQEKMAYFSERWKHRIYAAHIKDTAVRDSVVLEQGLMGKGTYLAHDDGIWVARVAGDGQIDFANALRPLHDKAQDYSERPACSALVHEIEDMYRFDLGVAGKGFESVVRAARHMDEKVLPAVYGPAR